MAILCERQVWKREPTKRGRQPARLTPEEEDRVRAALRFLAQGYGSNLRALTRDLRINRTTVTRALWKHRAVTPAMALRVARHAGVPLGDLLSGAWPKAGICPKCGASQRRRCARPNFG